MSSLLLEPIREQTPDEILRSTLLSYYLSMEENDPIRASRAKFWDHFLKLGMPSKKTAGYQYIPLRNLFDVPFKVGMHATVSQDVIDAHILPECRDNVIVFINGRFVKESSKVNAQTLALPLREAMRTYGTFINHRMSTSLKEECDPFAALNASLHSEACFVYVPPRTKLDNPLQILHLVNSDKEEIFFPRVQLFAGMHSHIEIVATSHYLNKSAVFCSSSFDFSLEERASVHFTSVNKPHENVWHFEAIRSQLKKMAYFKSIGLSSGSKSVKQDLRVSLLGEDGNCDLYGLWMLKDRNQAHANVFVDHIAPNCRSSQLFKSVLEDTAKSSFEGKIYVHPEAQKTDAFQLNRNLLLSENTIANSKPNLEIFADDVKASHGTTIGQLDDDALFYLKSRGIEDRIARQLLIQGFTNEILDLIKVKSAINEEI